MRPTAQRGTLVLLVTLLAGACDWFVEEDDAVEERETKADAGAQADAAPTPRDAQVVAECQTHSDCAIRPKAGSPSAVCCSCGPESLAGARALTREEAERERDACNGQVVCSPCPPKEHDPLAPVIRAACVSQRCVAIDVREEDDSRCESDADCTLESAGCCPGCGEDPLAYLSRNLDADPSLLLCDPIPPCVPCAEPGKPRAFCAADGHCAVRRSDAP